MQFDPRQGEALRAVVDSGSFEQAAALLHLTPSAVSQRVRALETAMGTPLLIRTRPCRPTPAGRRLLQHLRRVHALEQDLRAELAGDAALPQTVALAINADTLASWLLPALAPFLSRERILLDLTVDDQDHTYALLEAGQALGCISTEPQAMRGCVADALERCAIAAWRRRHFAANGSRAE